MLSGCGRLERVAFQAKEQEDFFESLEAGGGSIPSRGIMLGAETWRVMACSGDGEEPSVSRLHSGRAGEVREKRRSLGGGPGSGRKVLGENSIPGDTSSEPGEVWLFWIPLLEYSHLKGSVLFWLSLGCAQWRKDWKTLKNQGASSCLLPSLISRFRGSSSRSLSLLC